MENPRDCEIGVADFCNICLDSLIEDKELTLDQMCCEYIIPKVDIISKTLIRILNKDRIYYVTLYVEEDKMGFRVTLEYSAKNNNFLGRFG